MKGYYRLKEKLAELYTERRELEKKYERGMYGGLELSRRKTRITAEIAVLEHQMEKLLLYKRNRLHKQLEQLNRKHRSGKLDDKLYNKSFVRLNDRLQAVELPLSKLESGAGLYDYIRRDTQLIDNIKSKKKAERVALNMVFFFFVIVLFVYFIYSAFDLFHTDTESITQELNLNPDSTIRYEGVLWSISFESDHKSTYEGVVRYLCEREDTKQSMFTHDIILASGDYADENKVEVKYVQLEDSTGLRWYSEINPKGSITLVHVIPVSYEIYELIDSLTCGNQISITGYEIAELKNRESGTYWKDKGCNSLYVTDVKLLVI